MALDFEKPIVELESKINELKNFSSGKKVNLSAEIKKLEEKLGKMKTEIYDGLTPWQRVQLARHPQRPYTFDYIRLMMTDFVELHGDRLFADDLALVGGFAKLGDKKVMVMGHQKGRDTKENVMRNFGCAHPEGYRKAIRLMQLAEKCNIPIVIFIDTPGAYPGIGAEERGQAQAIACNLRDMVKIAVPIVATIIGEGGSGGALGIGIADKVCILQNAYYSVISPEGCASILWRSSLKAPEAAQALKLTAEDHLKFGVVDEIIPEPEGGAHRDPEAVAANLKKAVTKHLKQLAALSKKDLLNARYDKFRKLGVFETN
ncbi:MAG TPA: acetyl-CoA carboxylase carboxyltransferase subunit alpha [Candidatus Omnitrophota bacterium]|nr:acetyl-CoA carboxylase carboxyltransferase subunit alpha [Candidatus Omnitrophota bacterium]HPD84443.1 acetyl-CoA carboxylase carboxyltransferase subunit alpha [Candidatus Omnitrophota bacterium]HRZ03301.1 acetyl-CoA carboxylase carboxyltransferase subunit alpha [Candidatus Omnitrophota bacterium]